VLNRIFLSGKINTEWGHGKSPEIMKGRITGNLDWVIFSWPHNNLSPLPQQHNKQSHFIFKKVKRRIKKKHYFASCLMNSKNVFPPRKKCMHNLKIIIKFADPIQSVIETRKMKDISNL
jgi:hypothetical protein